MPKGFRYAGVQCGLKNKRRDLGLVVSEPEATVAGFLTANTVRAACVDYTRAILAGGRAAALVVNSGNANCLTGEQGERDCARMGELAAQAAKVSPERVLVASTGVIGHPLDMTKVERGIRDAASHLGPDPAPFREAILTTDLVEKQAEIHLGGATVLGIAKGSGMIEPNLATMLAFVFTDVMVELDDLQRVFGRAVDASFRCLTVDGDTSTNDMAIVMANGASGHRPTLPELEHALTTVCVDLAKQVARDGEGATKLVEVAVRGCAEPRRVAKTIANSPLVKTAMFGCDPNWGRILAAAGRSGVTFEPQRTRLWIRANGTRTLLFAEGKPQSFDARRVSADLKANTVRIELDLGGTGEESVVYTCDFGYGYVRINAEYHT